MKLSPTEIFKGKKIFFIGGTGRSADTLVRTDAASAFGECAGINILAGGTGDADRSVRAPFLK